MGDPDRTLDAGRPGPSSGPHFAQTHSSSLQEACNLLDTTSCCFHLAFLFPLNNLLPPTDLKNFIYPRPGMGQRARARAHPCTRAHRVTQGYREGVNTDKLTAPRVSFWRKATTVWGPTLAGGPGD